MGSTVPPDPLPDVDATIDAHPPTHQTPADEFFLSAGQELGHFVLIRQLGKGGFAVVWEAEDRTSGRRVALKVLRHGADADSEQVRRFEREARLAASVSHPNCVYVFGAHQIDGWNVISMELMRHGTLDQHLSAVARVPLEQAIEWMFDLLEGLDAVHRIGLVHRDIKPSNCFIDEDGKACLGDFGISKSLELRETLTADSAFVGTPAFAAPEQLRGGDLDARTDLYSLGATIYALITGSPPFKSRHGGELFAKILTEAPAPLTSHGIHAPPGLCEIIDTLLEKDPARRFSSCSALREALLPYRPESALPADRASRFWANVVDHGILALRGLVWPWGALPYAASVLILDVFSFAYFCTTEVAFGGSPGKKLLGLRVGFSDLGSGRKEVLLRNAIFWSVFAIIPDLAVAIAAPRLGWLVALGGRLLLLGVVAFPVRRSPGWQGLHEVFSRTRVVFARENRQSPEVTDHEGMRDWTGPGAIGPYRVAAPLGRSDRGTWLLAVDTDLRREVWIHVHEAPYATARDRTARRHAAQQRWIQGGTAEGNVGWDAYERLRGATLVRYAKIAAGGSVPWEKARGLLLRLGRCLRETAAEVTSIGQIWIDTDSQVRILDLPLLHGEDRCPRARETRIDIVRDAVYALLGEPLPGDILPKALLPPHAEGFIRDICAEPGPGMEQVVTDLEELQRRPIRPGRVRRALMIATEAAIPALLSVLIAVAIQNILGSRNPLFMFQSEFVQELVMREKRALNDGGGNARIDADGTGADALEIVVARLYAEQTFTREVTDIGPEENAVVNRVVRKHGNVSDERYRSAVAQLADAYPGLDSLTTPYGLAMVFLVLVLALPALLGAIFALCFREGLTHMIFDLRLRRETGGQPSRRRCLARSLIAWSPILLACALASSSGYLVHGMAALQLQSASFVIALVLYVAMRVHSIATPGRGIEDRIMGTQLVRT